MSIKIEIKCDCLYCESSDELYDNMDSYIERAGYHFDPNVLDTHYCHECWPKVQKEIQERNKNSEIK